MYYRLYLRKFLVHCSYEVFDEPVTVQTCHTDVFLTINSNDAHVRKGSYLLVLTFDMRPKWEKQVSDNTFLLKYTNDLEGGEWC
jgi:hypothetical protein